MSLPKYSSRLLRARKPSVSTSRLLVRVIHYAVIIFVILLLVAWYFLVGPRRHEVGSYYNRNENAVWAPHAWVDQTHTPEEVRSFVETLGSHGVKYVFLHVGPIEPDGTIPPERYALLSEFLRTSRQYGDRIQFLAWMGQLRSKIHLEDINVRRNIVKTAGILIQDFGMDGIHYDIEPIVDDDSDFLFLLEDTKKAIGNDKTLSVALPELIPDYVFWIASRFMDLKSYLSSEFYREVAARSDQIAVMTYENSIKAASVYQYFLKNQVIWVTQLLSHEKAKVLIGLPTYDKQTETFYPAAENIQSGLLGVIDGLNSWRSDVNVFQGVALYGSWYTDDNEWKTLETLFIKKP